MTTLLTSLLGLFIFIPLIGFALTMLVPKKNEDAISWIAYFPVGSHMVVGWVFLVLWLIEGHPPFRRIDLILSVPGSSNLFISSYLASITPRYPLGASFLCSLRAV